jgi:hypothetical protein
MAEIKSDIRVLLAAARRGDFTALLAAADYWAEHAGERASEFSLHNWNYLVANAVRMTDPGWHARHPRLSPLDNTARYFREFAYSTSYLHGNCWKIPNPLYRKHPAWDWCKDMAFALLKYAKARRAAEAR